MSRRSLSSEYALMSKPHRKPTKNEIAAVTALVTGTGIKTIAGTATRKLYGSEAVNSDNPRFGDRVGHEAVEVTAIQSASAVRARRIFYYLANRYLNISHTDIARFLFPDCNADNIRCAAFRGYEHVAECIRKFEKVVAKAEIDDGIYDNEKLIDLLREETFETRKLTPRENCYPDEFLQRVVWTAMTAKRARKMIAHICSSNPVPPKTPDLLKHHVSLSAIMAPEQVAKYVGA